MNEQIISQDGYDKLQEELNLLTTVKRKEIAERIEKELKYPGEIKIAVIRESRIIEYAR